MKTNKELAKIGVCEIYAIHGEDYVKNLLENAQVFFGFCCDGAFLANINMKTKKETPDLTPNSKGWTVFASIYIDGNSGEVLNKEYQTEDGLTGDVVFPYETYASES